MRNKLILIFFCSLILVCSLGVAFADDPTDPAKKAAINEIQSVFKGLEDSLNDSVKQIVQAPRVFSPKMADVIGDIQTPLRATGIALCGLLFIMSLCNKTMMFEVANYEVIAKLVIRLFLAKVLVDNSADVMNWIFLGFNGVISELREIGIIALDLTLKNNMIDHVNRMDGGPLGIGYYMYTFSMKPTFILIWGCSLLIGLIAVGRMFELILYTAIAPIPLATLAAEETSDIAKRFFQNYVAVCLQGAIIIIVFLLFSALITDVYTRGTNINKFLILILILTITLFKSGTWARNIVGAH